MAKTGPQKFPGASTAYWYQTRWGGDAMESNTIVWHSTEGTSLPSYDGGSMAPNFTAVPDYRNQRLTWYQHFDFDVSSRALVHAGAVATNTLNVCQVEIVGTCDPATHLKWQQAGIQHLYMAELPNWVVRDLGVFAKWAHDNHGVPLSSGLTFKAYPGSYGTSNGVRMTNSQWLSFEGHCGHQHVPSGNVHGDPGAFPMTAILTAAKGGATNPPQENPVTDTAFTSVWKTDNSIPAGSTEKNPANKFWAAQTYLTGTFENTVSTLAQARTNGGLLTSLISKVDSITTGGIDLDALATKVAGSQALIDAIASKVAADLAARLAE